jgi:hypothetical protein
VAYVVRSWAGLAKRVEVPWAVRRGSGEDRPPGAAALADGRNRCVPRRGDKASDALIGFWMGWL